jgi:type I restriction enzyme S subunit
MGEWIEIVVGNYAEVLPGYAFDSTCFCDKSKGIPLIRIRDLKKNETEINFNGKYPDRYLINKNDILIGMDGDFHVARWNGHTALLNQRVCKVTAKTELHNGLLYYLLIGELLKIQNQTTGTTVKHLSNSDVAEVKLRIPKEQNEQLIIATILTTIDKIIEKTEQLIDKYEHIKTGLMQDLLTRGIDEQGNIRSEVTHEFKDSVLGRIPIEWEIGRLCNWAKVKGGFAFQSKDFTTSGTQLLRIGNLFNIQLDLLRSPVFLPDTFLQMFFDFALKKGDIIMSMTGTYGKRDYGYAIAIENGNYLMNQRICKFIFDENVMDSSFLLFLLRSEYYLDGLFKSVTGSKQGNLKNSNILDVEIALPKLDEQRVISDKISALYLVLKEEKRNLEKLRKLQTSLMQDLLTGKVRVDVLMEPIKMTYGQTR